LQLMEGKLSGLLAFADGTNSTLHCGAILQGDQSLPLNGAHEGRSFIPQNTLKIIIGDDEFDAADLDEKMSYSSNIEPHLAEIRKCYFELPRRLVKDSFVIRFGGFLAETKDINISISTPETQSASCFSSCSRGCCPHECGFCNHE
jgi:hypothetical protein